MITKPKHTDNNMLFRIVTTLLVGSVWFGLVNAVTVVIENQCGDKMAGVDSISEERKCSPDRTRAPC